MRPGTRRKLISAIAVGAVVGAGAGVGLLTLTPAPAVDQVASRNDPAGASPTTIATATTVEPTPDTVADSAADSVQGTDPQVASVDPVGVETNLGTRSDATQTGSTSSKSAGATSTRSRRATPVDAPTGTPKNAPTVGVPNAGPPVGVSAAESGAEKGGNSSSTPNPAPSGTEIAPRPAVVAPSAPQAASVRLGFDTAGTTIRRAAPLVAIVSWQRPASGTVTSYQITCQSVVAGTRRLTSTATAGSDSTSVAMPNLVLGRSHQCSVVAVGPGGSSPAKDASGAVTPLAAPPSVSIGTCQLGAPDGIIGERYLVQGLPPTPSNPGVSAATYQMRSSIDQHETELRRLDTSTDLYWASLDEFKGAYTRRAGSKVTVWVEWKVVSGGTTFTMQGPESTGPCT